MKSPSPNVSPVDDTAVTGLRQIPAQLGSTLTSHRAATPSAPGALSPGTWELDAGLESELPVPEGELLNGRYLVERMFAEGGMGIVCLGRHAQLDQPVAIKFLRRALSGKPAVVQRFLNEARALAQLRSEHVVRVMDVGQLDSGRPYLVMEHLEGVDLDALVARDGPLSVETAVSYVLQVCEPLAEAHALGIVHRDIKPENLFLWSGGPAGDIVKVLDFGLAKQLDASKALAVTGPQDSIGSPCYMSPEQIVTPQSIDSRTDIWSLGVVLHRLLTDSLPFDGANLLEVLSHVLNAAPRSLTSVMPSLDPELDAIVARCLEKSPDARYATMSELSDALNAYLEHRRAGELPEPPPRVSAVPQVDAVPEPIDGAKIRIPGVHSRWPGFLVLLLVAGCAAAYQADRSGVVRLRELSAGWLTPAQLAADPEPLLRLDRDMPALSLLRGVVAAEPVRDEHGALSLRAERELDRPDAADATSPDSDRATSVAILQADRARRAATYGANLPNHGPSPVPEALPTVEATPTPTPEPPPPPTDNPYP